MEVTIQNEADNDQYFKLTEKILNTEIEGEKKRTDDLRSKMS
jgi:hypothetical protein